MIHLTRYGMVALASIATVTLATPSLASGNSLRAPVKTPLKQWSLKNGLTVLFVADHKAPVVAVQVFYHAGAKDEPADKRGMAHMFEHMMFKGSEHLPPEEHARDISLVGGENNAQTNDDWTAYFDTVPPSAADFAMKLEAERMRNLTLTQKTIDSERQVVEEELRLRIDNSPIGKALKAELALAYKVHPYRVIAAGEKRFLDTVTPADCQAFYDNFYRPNNAALVVVGDIDEATVRALAEKHFGKLERGPEIVRALAKEPAQTELRTQKLTMPVQLPVIIGGYHVPPAADPDIFALEVLQQILAGGESSRLYQRLVRKDKLAVNAGGFVYGHEDPGLFLTYALYLPKVDAAKIGAALDEEVAKLTDEKVDARELEKAKNQLAAGAVYQRERAAELAQRIGNDWAVAHDATRPLSAAQKYDAVTADDVQRVARKYLVKTNLSAVTLVPGKESSGAAPRPPNRGSPTEGGDKR